MDSPNISMRIRRHESLPCYGLHRSPTSIHSPTKASPRPRSNRVSTQTSFLIGRRLGATKNNPYIGSFRHAPPTSLRSMAVSSLPSLSSRNDATSSSKIFLSPYSTTFAANSPYVGWFRHAPPVFPFLGSNESRSKQSAGAKKLPKTSSIVQHKINLDSLLELDRWHHQLSSLLLGVCTEDTEKKTPLLMREIVNGRLLGGSGKDSSCRSERSNRATSNSIIEQCNRIHRSDQNRIPPSSSSNTSETIHHLGNQNTALSRLASWLLFPLIYDDCGTLQDEFNSKKSSGGLKLQSIDIDSDETDNDEDSYYSDSSTERISPETEREFSQKANLSASEIAEAYYAHQLLDERRRRSDSDLSQQSGLSHAALHSTTDFTEEEETQERLDYEITQMDIARMTRNASRHLDVDSILNLPTIVYKKQRPSRSASPKQNTQFFEHSYHHVCTQIQEERNDYVTQGDGVNSKTAGNDKSILSENGWSFLMVNKMESSTACNSIGEFSCDNLTIVDEREKEKANSSSDDTCVICLERFREGDRLRVLPCNHSFHVGCIDRWLTGSHSHNECFTAGCPICKKRPNMQASSSSSSSLQLSTLERIETDEKATSGSLPSWAFANLGSAMAMSSGNIADTN